MRKNDKIVALIPMRAGSVRLPGKHIKKLAGFSPALRSVNAALGTPGIGTVYVATNDKNVRSVLRKKPILFFDRSEKSAAPEARTEALIDEFAEKVDFKILVLIQATNVFVNAWHLNKALDLYRKFDPDTLISGVLMYRYFFQWSDTMHLRTFLDSELRPGLAKTHGLFVENGGFYIFKRDGYLKHRLIVHGVVMGYQMPFESIVELDTSPDWALAEAILGKGITYA